MSNFQPLGVVDRVSETQLQVAKNYFFSSRIRVKIVKYSDRFPGLIVKAVSASVSACHRDTVRDSAAWNGHGMRKGILQLPNPARDPCHPFTRDTEGGWSGHRTLAQQRFDGGWRVFPPYDVIIIPAHNFLVTVMTFYDMSQHVNTNIVHH